MAVGSSRTGSSTSTADFAVAMFRNDGALETGFGDTGKATFDLSGGARDEATDAVLWQGMLVLAGFSGNAPGDNTLNYALLGLDFNGQPIADFTVNGPIKTIDFFGDADQAQAVVVGTSELTLVGTAVDPLLRSATEKIAGLARLNDFEVIFSDGFESL